MSRKNGLRCWEPSGRLIPILSQPALMPGGLAQSRVRKEPLQWSPSPCDVAYSPEFILKHLRRAGSQQCDSIPGPNATLQAQPEFSSKSLKTMQLLPASEPLLPKFVTDPMAGATAPQGISLLSTYSRKRNVTFISIPSKILELRRVGKINICLEEEDEICGWFCNFKMWYKGAQEMNCK